jgi:hypothetical protein
MTEMGDADIKTALLDFCSSVNNIRPGSLLVAKEFVSFNGVYQNFDVLKSVALAPLASRKNLPTIIRIPKGGAVLFVDVHGIEIPFQDKVSWDFWYELLYMERSFFVHAFELGERTLSQFVLRNA